MLKIWDSGSQTYRDPEFVRRYDTGTGAWVDCQRGQVLKAGAWEEVWPVRPKVLYIIKDGISDNSITGGWYWHTVVGRPAASQGQGCLILTNSFESGSTNRYITNKSIPLQGYSKLYATVETAAGTGDTNIMFGLSALDAAYCRLQGTNAKKTVYAQFAEANESSLYFAVQTRGGTTTAKVYDMWLE